MTDSSWSVGALTSPQVDSYHRRVYGKRKGKPIQPSDQIESDPWFGLPDRVRLPVTVGELMLSVGHLAVC